MSNNGDPIGHSKIWRDFNEKPKFVKQIVSSKKIKDAFAKKHGKDKVKEVRAEKMYFGYFGKGRYSQQETFEPVYMIGYTTGSESKEVYEVFNAYTGEEIVYPDPVASSNSR